MRGRKRKYVKLENYTPMLPGLETGQPNFPQPEKPKSDSQAGTSQNQKSEQNLHSSHIPDTLSRPDHEFLLQTKWEELIKYIYPTILRTLPRADRGTFGVEIRKLLADVLELLCAISHDHGIRAVWLREVDRKATILQRMIVIGSETPINPQTRMTIISKDKREVSSRKLKEIGKIIGGLLKSKRIY